VKYYVLLIHQNGRPLPLCEDDGWTMAEFDTAEAAADAARKTLMGSHFGWNVFSWESGIIEVIQ
jgi:hypothetical protein